MFAFGKICTEIKTIVIKVWVTMVFSVHIGLLYYYEDNFYFLIAPITEKTINTKRLTSVTEEPAGTESKIMERQNPVRKQKAEIITELTVTEKKDLKILMDDMAGKTIRADIKRAPISLMPITTVTDTKIAITVL